MNRKLSQTPDRDDAPGDRRRPEGRVDPPPGSAEREAPGSSPATISAASSAPRTGIEPAPDEGLGPGDPGLPAHIAIIMDGNGRWARERGLPRVRGHREGAESVRIVTTECARLGIERLTLYAFSLENWKRPSSEIAFLMRLLKRFLIQERPTITNNNIRFTAMGRLDDLPHSVRRHLQSNTEMSRSNTGLNLCLALSYGARAELVDTARALARRVAAGEIEPDEIDEGLFARHLYEPCRDPDLLIRTAGEHRISNFLLWQLSYTELYFAEICWPEFRVPQLHASINAYRRRRRTFGGLEAIPAPLPDQEAAALASHRFSTSRGPSPFRAE